jgi:hypothetical protein
MYVDDEKGRCLRRCYEWHAFNGRCRHCGKSDLVAVRIADFGLSSTMAPSQVIMVLTVRAY